MVVAARIPAVAGYAGYRDFQCYRLRVRAIRWVGGFGEMDWVDTDAYGSADVDPVLPHRHAIAAHMNDDHADAGAQLCERSLGRTVSSATMRHVDRYGCEYVARIDDDDLALVRLGFSAPAAGADDVQRLVVELVQAALLAMRALALVALLAVAACGGGSGDDATVGPSVAAPATAAVAAPTTTSVPATVERIVPVNGDLAEVVYALGLGDQVVATDISATFPPAAQQTPKIGYQRTLVAETILSFDPTVVLADDNAGPPEVLQQLEAAGVRVVRFAKEETIDAPARKIREVAAALGVADRGEALVATLDADLAAATARAAAAVAATGTPKVLALYLRGPNVQLAFGKDSGIDAVIAAAGGIDAGTEMGVVDNAELSIESIVDEAPDVLLVTTTGLESVGGVDGLLAIPGLDRTPAAQHRAVAAFEDQYLYGLGPRTGVLVGELVTAFHPHAPTP